MLRQLGEKKQNSEGELFCLDIKNKLAILKCVLRVRENL